MSEREAIVHAGFWKRAAARAIDACLSVLFAVLLTVVAAFTAVFVAQPNLFGEENWDSYYSLLALLMVPGLVLVARYEVAATARRGRTPGKKNLGIRVVHCGDPHGSFRDWEYPEPLYSLIRWAIPHNAGVFAALVAGAVVVPRIGGFGVLVGAGVGLAAWTVVYLSALLDKDGRGWHDKAAGTVVVEAASLPPKRAPQDPQPRRPASPGPARPAPVDSQPTFGLVSDYYAPVRSPSPQEGDPQAGAGSDVTDEDT